VLISPITFPISHKKTGILLGIDSKTVWTYWKDFQLHGFSDALTGQPSILTDEHLDRVTEFAVEQLYSMQPVTCASLAWFIRSQYAIDASPDTIRRTLRREPVWIFRWKSGPMDGAPTVFISNIDEISHSHPEAADVPGDLSADQFPIPVDRGGKHITLANCICLDDSLMKPIWAAEFCGYLFPPTICSPQQFLNTTFADPAVSKRSWQMLQTRVWSQQTHFVRCATDVTLCRLSLAT
jgi:hypothetical protein